jgi:hypothetical protein
MPKEFGSPNPRIARARCFGEDEETRAAIDLEIEAVESVPLRFRYLFFGIGSADPNQGK